MKAGIKSGMDTGMKTGRREGELQKAQKVARALLDDGMSIEKISQIVDIEEDTVREWIKNYK